MAVTYSPSDVAAAMRRAGFSEAAIPTGVAVATAESGRRTVQSNIVNNGKREGSYGVWQINDFWLGPNSLMAPLTLGCTYDLDCSTKAAYAISRGGSDWSPWSVFTSGSYLNFLNLAPTAAPSSATPTPPSPVSPAAPSSFAAAPSATPANVPTLASRFSGSGLFSTPILGGLVTVGTKSVITVALIGVIFVGFVKVAGGNPGAVAKDVAKVAK